MTRCLCCNRRNSVPDEEYCPVCYDAVENANQRILGLPIVTAADCAEAARYEKQERDLMLLQSRLMDAEKRRILRESGWME